MNDNALSNNPMYKINMEVDRPGFFTELRKTGLYGITITGDFDLNGSKEFLLEVLPGSADGSLVFRQTTTDLVDNQVFERTVGLTYDRPWTTPSTGDSPYDPITFSGLGHSYLKKNIDGGKNVLNASMMDKANMVYHILHDYSLEDVITIPSNCILSFEGGSIDMSGGTELNPVGLVLNNTRILAEAYQIFIVGDMINKGVMTGSITEMCNGTFWSSITGTMLNDRIYPQWFGAKGDCDYYGNTGTDDSSALQYALNMSNDVRIPVYLPVMDYRMDNTVYLPRYFKLIGDSFTWAQGGSRLMQYCRYLFRPKWYEANVTGGVLDEQKRLRNMITCIIDGVGVLQCHWSQPYTPAVGNTEQRDIAAYLGDPYYIRKNYVFYGGVFSGSEFTRIRTNNIGTFLYGSWIGCSDMHNCMITCYRDFMSMNVFGEFVATDAKYATSSCQSMTELGNSTSMTYGGKTYEGYQEEIEGFKRIAGSSQETLMDSTIHHNYINCGYLRGCMFSKVNASVSHITHNFIDFFYSVFYEPFNMKDVDFSHNTVDICLIFIMGNIHGLQCKDNLFDKIRYTECCTDALWVYQWNDMYEDGVISSAIPKRGSVRQGVIFLPYYGWNGVQNVMVMGNKFYKCDMLWKNSDEYLQRSFNFTMKDNQLDDVTYPWDTVYNKGFKKFTGASAIDNDLENIHIQFLERLEVAGIANAPSARTYADTNDATTGVVINKDTVVLDTLTGKEWHSYNNLWHDAMGNAQS